MVELSSATIALSPSQSRALVEQFPEAAVQDFGPAAIVPGLINGHSHLELTAMRGLLENEEGDFFGWLRKLTVARLERMNADDLECVGAVGSLRGCARRLSLASRMRVTRHLTA